MCKRYTFLFCLFFFCSSQSLFSQKLIALHHGGTASFFTDLSTALANATNGDTMYLPGGTFPAFTLNKMLTIIGAGHHPDSTMATSTTIINGNINVSSDGNNSCITGMRIIGGIIFNQNSSDITVQRCYPQTGLLCEGGNNRLIISENIIGSHPTYSGGGYYQTSYSLNFSTTLPNNCLITNNIILGLIKNIHNSSVRNNIFFLSCTWNIITGTFCSILSDCLLENNITDGALPNGSNNIFNNNLNIGVNGSDGNGNQGSNNILSIDFNSLFIQYTTPWDYSDDLHLVNSTYNTGGNDGTPIGLYGGTFPWKEGSLPFNPHIRAKTIGSTTNPDGTLHINIMVKAQGN